MIRKETQGIEGNEPLAQIYFGPEEGSFDTESCQKPPEEAEADHEQNEVRAILLEKILQTY